MLTIPSSKKNNPFMNFDIKICISSKIIDDTRCRLITLLTSHTFMLCFFLLFSSVGNMLENNFYLEESDGFFTELKLNIQFASSFNFGHLLFD